MEPFRKYISAVVLLVYVTVLFGSADIHHWIVSAAKANSIPVLTNHDDAHHCHHIPADLHKECVLCSSNHFSIQPKCEPILGIMLSPETFFTADRKSARYVSRFDTMTRRGPPPVCA
jgi:hypothetical protein